jgi:hypothetical protein
MLTIFTIPKPFEGDIGRIQKNAIQSWLCLGNNIEIILFGQEEGVKEIAEEFKVKNIQNIAINSFGTPLINDVFKKAQEVSRNQILAYVNADIILTGNFLEAVKSLNLEKYLIVGRRTDLKVDAEIDFKDAKWQNNLIKDASERGRLHSATGIDYFIFPKGLFKNIPPFAVGRPYWDCWLVYFTRFSKISVIDATALIMVIHQNHESSHEGIRKDPLKRKEAELNKFLSKNGFNILTIREANLLLTLDGLRLPDFPRIIFSKLALFYPWRILLTVKREIVNFTYKVLNKKL